MTSTNVAKLNAHAATGRFGLGTVVANCVLPAALILISVAISFVAPAFVTPRNAINVLEQASYLTIFATGQLFALVTRGFDLSVGTVSSTVSVVAAIVMTTVVGSYPDSIGFAIAAGCVAGLVVGLVAGAINGISIAFLRVNPFIATLGTMGIGLGLSSTLSGGFPVSGLPNEFTLTFSRSELLGVPAPIAVAAMVLAVAYLVLNRTTLGRCLFLLGSNPRAGYVAGLPTQAYLAVAYVICALCVAIGALMLTARTGSGEPSLGGGLMIQSITAAVVGGVSLRGGEGRIWHCVLGALFVTVLSNGMNLTRVDGYFQQIILGVVIIFAVFIDGFRARLT